MRAANSLHNLFALAFVLALTTAAGGAAAAKFKVLHSFCQGGMHHVCGDGSNLQGALVSDAAGDLFGTAAAGGHGFGTVFELERKPNGAFKVRTLYRFCGGACLDGADPFGALIVDMDGNLYGTASRGGNSNNGVVFELSPSVGRKLWTEKVLYTLCSVQGCIDGSGPSSGLTYEGATTGSLYDGASPLYGTAAAGGAHNNGAVFQLTLSKGQWSETAIYSFCSTGGENCTDGSNPIAALTLDSSGNLFGMTEQGGGNDQNLNGAGVVFQLVANGDGTWRDVTLHRFCSLPKCTDGARPWGDLTVDSSGVLYGTTLLGGGSCDLLHSDGCGVVFKLAPNGEASQETVLYKFCEKSGCRDGAAPKSGVLVTGTGDLVGTTSLGGNGSEAFPDGAGTVFRLSGSKIEVLHKFCAAPDCIDGASPNARPSLDYLGNILGSTDLGGKFGESPAGGVIYKITK